MKRTQTLEQKKYEAKVKEISSTIEQRARVLSELDGQLTAAKSLLEDTNAEVLRLEAERDKLIEDKAQLEKDLAKARAEFAKEVQGQGEVFEHMRKNQEAMEASMATLNATLRDREETISSLSTIVTKLEASVEALNKEQDELQAKILEAKEVLAKLEVEAAAQREEREKLEISKMQHSRLVSALDSKLGLLEQYVKRLQRYYDQNGIKINLLEQFEIKRDNIK